MSKVTLLKPMRGLDNRDSDKRKLNHATNVALRWMAARWPEAFPDDTDRIHPLVIGIRDQILDALSSSPDTASSAPDTGLILRALGIWTRSPPYCRAAAAGRDRINLDGSVASPIQPSHQAYAQRLLDERKERQQAKRAPASPPPPRPAPAPKATTRPVIKLRRASA
jgi:sRNA-binding protein